MGRLPLAMVACLVFGAGVMWIASNFKLKVESAGAPEPSQAAPIVSEKPAAIPAEPGLLPGHIVARAPSPTDGVQQAGAVGAPPVTPPAGPIAKTEDAPDVSETVDMQAINWGKAASPLLLATSAPTLKYPLLAKDDKANPRIVLTGTTTKADVFGSYDAATGVLLLDLTKPKDAAFAPGKSIALTITRVTTDTPPVEVSSSVVLVRPVSNDPIQFSVDKASVTKGLATKDLPLAGTDANIVNEYVRFQGTGLGAFASAAFYVIVDGKPTEPTLSSRVTPQLRQEVWEYELVTKPFATGATGRFLARADFAGGGHTFVMAKGTLTFTKNFNPIPAPAIALAKASSVDSNTKLLVGAAAKSPTTGLTTVNANTRLVKATVTADAAAKAVALYLDNRLVGVKDRAATVEFNEIEIGDGREHLFRAEAILGSTPSTGTQLAVNVVTTPPRVDSVIAPGFGQSNGNGTETIRIRFNSGNPLERATAEAIANYEVSNANPADTVARLQGTPSLDEGTNTVTLTVNKIVPGSYTVRVKPAVLDNYGNALFIVPGTTATFAFEATLLTGGAGAEAALPSQSIGVTLGTGKNAEFGEYTKFRVLPDGFNPSDRVETRVVRLYYSRDAHRVAQIVNRDVKSFNAQSVDIRRRAADRIRDEANGAQDERQKLERAAVQAAVATRMAENEVKQLEARQQAARTDQATARIQLTQREQQLAVAQRELDRVRPGTADIAANDAAVEQQRAKIFDINEDLRRTQATKSALPAGDPRIAELQTRENLLTADREREQRALAAITRDAEARSDRSLDSPRNQVKALADETAKLRQVQAAAAANEQQLADQLTAARSKVQGLRSAELVATESALGKDSEERRKREEQFRREVAAALADPDTYAAGRPDSIDPVLQCSISVIGEGLIQIRGPIKGLNVIRTMVNQIDAPVGQVRVGVHTVQVNGERVEKMDKVVTNIQRYLDHSRFLTTQSAQMLRKAVTTVASRRAMEAAASLPSGCTQADRDAKYLYCFFGKDFIDELKSLDSEFLKTGNKILSLHSMDSTSLSSALFLMSLAKNDIRQEILDEFQAQLGTKLPAAELEYYLAGMNCPTRCEAHCDKAFCVLAKNAKFVSFLGFFNTEVQGNDTLSPLQREFIRLAQIFKARMVTEMELKQRVMERSLLEDRVGNFQQEQVKAKAREDEARMKRLDYQVKLQSSIVEAAAAFGQLGGELDTVEKELKELEVLLKVLDTSSGKVTIGGQPRDVPVTEAGDINFKADQYSWISAKFIDAANYFTRFYYFNQENYELYKGVNETLRKLATDKSLSRDKLKAVRADTKKLFALIQAQIEVARGEISSILRELRKDKPNIDGVLTHYAAFRENILAVLREGEPMKEVIRSIFAKKVGPALDSLQNTFVAVQAADRTAQLSRRPLDEKKLLDMLVDDLEEKYIELLDGTRAHTANVDNYLKALSTSLDDDFATQFYGPAFSKIRTLAADWSVQLGQIESTTVLTNNRSFGKVSPTASMEFDLPRRDILIKEAFKGAKAAIQDYGALLNDPVFLSLVKMYGGNPVGAQFSGGGGALPAVKNVLPGLPGSSDEMIMAQGGSNRKEFGTYVEALIPDPAIYKIETGTGYEIRPVISPDGQAVVFGFDYMYTTDIREPVRADEKHLGRVKRHFVHTDVQLSNFEMREVSKYWVSLKVARTGKGVALLQDIPVAGALFRPAPSASSSLQQNIIYSQAAIFPTLFDLMGLRYAPTVADITPDGLINDEFVVRGRRDYLRAFIFDYGASRVDDALRIMYGERRADLYRSQQTIPSEHPNGYRGPGLRQRDSDLQEDYIVKEAYPPSKFVPGMQLPLKEDRDPYGLPPGVTIPGHPTQGRLPYSEYQAKPIGNAIIPAPLPRDTEALKAPRVAPPSVPVVFPAVPAVPALPPLPPLPTLPPVPPQGAAPSYRSGPVALAPSQYFPK